MTTWKIDPAHSAVEFKVRHMMISNVRGEFKNFDGIIEFEPEKPEATKVNIQIEVASIDTKVGDRDNHLRAADFFDAANYPKVSFSSRSVERLSGQEYQVTGDLPMRGVAKEVVLNVSYGGTVAGFGGGQVAAFEIQGKVNRFDFGLQWNGLTEAGGIVVSSEVKLEILAELNQVQSEAVAA